MSTAYSPGVFPAPAPDGQARAKQVWVIIPPAAGATILTKNSEDLQDRNPGISATIFESKLRFCQEEPL